LSCGGSWGGKGKGTAGEAAATPLAPPMISAVIFENFHFTINGSTTVYKQEKHEAHKKKKKHLAET